MKQDFTLHTHSIGFDGKNTIIEMVDQAKQLGFTTIGISNHFIVNPTIKNSKMYPYAVKGGYSNIYSTSFNEVMERFIPLYEEIYKLRELNPDINILCGMETDFFNNNKWLKGFEKSINILKPDYIIGSTHFIEYNGELLNTHDWKHADAETQDLLLKQYWSNLANAAKSGLFTWMAHLNLPKKVGLGKEKQWAEYELRTIDAIKQSGTAIEINTALYDSEYNEQYPSNRILQMVQVTDIPVLISDDAHKKEQIGRHFDRADKIIQDMRLKRYQR